MQENVYDRVLTCPALPTLPTIAVRLLELTRDPNVSIPEIGRLVQSDPGLSAKILRTVNSSLYALTRPCTTIDRALGLLGLKSVKSLVLGFSLIESVRGLHTNPEFDPDAFWRRAIFTSAAARQLAAAGRACDPDEAFVGGLFQDMGMLAACVALDRVYTDVLAQASQDHRVLSAVEHSALGFTHAQVGADLASRWSLPKEIVACVRFHHDPALAPPPQRPLADVMHASSLAASVLMGGHGALNEFGQAVRRLGLDDAPDAIEPLLSRIAETASHIASGFRRPLGPLPDVARLMAEANERLVQLQLETARGRRATTTYRGAGQRGLHRCTHRALKPQGVRSGARGPVEGRRTRRAAPRAAVHRRRPLQDCQRHSRAHRGRRGACRTLTAPLGHGLGRGHGVPLRRGRVRRAPARV